MKPTMKAALIPNIKMLITIVQYQLTFPSSGSYCTGGENKIKKEVVPVMSLITSSNKTNYDDFVPIISN